MLNLIRKIIYKIYSNPKLKLISIIRCYYYFKRLDIRIGKNVSLLGYSENLVIGKDINIYNNCVFELGPNAKLDLGNHIIFSYGVVLCCQLNIKIGSDVQIGEFTSIRDTTHDYTNFGKPIMYNKDISNEIVIGDNVWIGRNCLIAPGAKIGNGVVVGANSLVKGVLEDNGVFVGNPIRKIADR